MISIHGITILKHNHLPQFPPQMNLIITMTMLMTMLKITIMIMLKITIITMLIRR